MRRALGVLLSLGVVLAVYGAAAVPLPRDALWLVVRSCLVAHQTLGRPFPCLDVQGAKEEAGYAVIRAPGSPTHIIVTPLIPLPGIESRELLQDGAGAYWRAALAARRFVTEGASGKVPEAAVGLALNSMETRSQDQLHIHAECLRSDVIATLGANLPALGPEWSPVPGLLHGERYLARELTRDDIANRNIFAMLSTMPGADGDLSRSKVLLVQAGERYVLAVTRSSRRSIESLLDEGCSRFLRQG